MKLFIALLMTLSASSSFAYTVIDTMYETSMEESFERVPASSEAQYCLVDEDQRVFAKSCYSTSEHCEKRLDFWKDLPGAKPSSCVKI